MSVLDMLNASKIKAENARLQEEIKLLRSYMTPEMRDAEKLSEAIARKKSELESAEGEIQKARERAAAIEQERESLLLKIEDLKEEIVDIDEKIALQSFALYEPKYDFVNSEEYKKSLDVIRGLQKKMIKEDTAIVGDMNWMVNNSKAQGNKLVNDMRKLLLRAFNSECDAAIDKVTYSNYESARKKITSSCEAVSKCGSVMNISISNKYLKSKLQELDLAFEYRQMKQKEKEEQKELRARMREEAKLQKEIEEARKKVEKEQQHYSNALSALQRQLETVKEEDRASVLEKIAEVSAMLSEAEKSLKDIDYREANAKAGYVYVISNIGAFGENVFKIGMTRRLDPTERVDELGDASVPFDFDIHAMIFSDNAPALEAALHQAFEDRKLNLVNHRREFFNVTLDEIKEVVKKNFDKSVEFTDLPQAEQYRTSLKLREREM